MTLMGDGWAYVNVIVCVYMYICMCVGRKKVLAYVYVGSYIYMYAGL